MLFYPTFIASGAEYDMEFQSLLEGASVGIVMVDQEGRIEMVNQKAEELFGYERNELLGQVLEQLLPIRYHSLHQQHRLNYQQAPRVREMGVGFDLVGLRKDGTEFPIEIGLSYLQTQKGFFSVAFISDISARKKAETALQRHTQRLEAMRAIDQAILDVSPLKTIAQVALNHLPLLIPSLYASVFVFEWSTKQASLLATTAREEGKLVPQQLVPLEAWQALERLQAGEYVIQTTNCEVFNGYPEGMAFEHFSCLDVPLKASEGELLGVIRLLGDGSHSFRLEEAEMVHEMANQVAIAIQQVRLRAERKRHAEELEARVQERTREIERRREVAEGLRDILQVLNSNRPLEEILSEIVTLAGQLLKTDASVLYERHTSDERLTLVAAHGLSLHPQTEELALAATTAVLQAWREREPVAISVEGQGTAFPYRSLLAVPLIIKGEVYGSLVLYYTDSRAFSEEVGLAVAFGDQAALAIENARLRAQVRQSAVTAERNRIARDLHDAVTQTLFSASLIAEVLPRLMNIKPNEGRRRLEELRQLTRGALAEMRTLLFELRPTVLIKTDLRDLLRQLAEGTTSRARLPIEVTVEGRSVGWPPDVQVALYRIAQEALNNVAKHSAASQGWVHLRCDWQAGHTLIELSVRDDGQGFVLEEVAPERLGLNIMQERADAIGATLFIESKLGEGTEIRAIWLKNQKEKH